MGDNGSMNPPVLDIVCLCAAWCGTCGAYAQVFQALQQAWPGHRFRWIDIEDEADLVGEVDVETFPTWLVAHQGRVLFAGPVLPRQSDAQRMLEAQVSAAQRGDRMPLALPPEQLKAFEDLAARL